jgi:hypothetical protein
VQVQDEPYQRVHVLEPCHPYGDNGYFKMCQRRSSPIVDYGGTTLKNLLHMHNQERHSILMRAQSSSPI